MANKERLTVNLSTEEYQELQALAHTQNVSMAWLGRRAISQLLEQSVQRQLPIPLDNKRRAGIAANE